MIPVLLEGTTFGGAITEAITNLSTGLTGIWDMLMSNPLGQFSVGLVGVTAAVSIFAYVRSRIAHN